MKLNSLMIRASAGSGKTFQLSNRVLALLAAGAEPAEVIALTFTRKAAGEFADRILSRLASGALNEAEAAKLADALADTLHGEASKKMPALFEGAKAVPLDLARIRELLEKLVTELHRISLTTLDSFFVRIAKRFPYELGISQLSLMETDEEEAERRLVMSRIFREVTEQQRMAFLNAFKLATYGKEELRLTDLLNDFLVDHHQRYLACPERDMWGNMAFLWPKGCPWPEVNDFAKAAQDVCNLISKAPRVDGKKPEARWETAWADIASGFANYAPGTGAKFPSLVAKSLDALSDLHLRGATILKHYVEYQIDGPLADALKRLIGGYLRAEIEVKATQTEGLWAMLWAYEAIYEKEVRRLGKLGFADVTRLLAEHQSIEIESRLDARYKQWLLDEFQDTSRMQSKVLEDMLDEAVLDSEGARSVFVVGDTKQGIYGWRGGEPRLFDDLLDRVGWRGRMLDCGMQTSWRSAQEVLDLANDVCDPTAPAMRERFPKAALERWKYVPHTAASRGEPIAGYIAVIDTDAEESADDTQAEDDGVLEESAIEKALHDLLAHVQPVQRGLSCAILVQSNQKARDVVDFLRRKFPALPVEMDAEVRPGTDNPLGSAVLDWFRWLAHPKDDLAAGHVAHSPLRGALATFCHSRTEQWQTCRAIMSRDGVAGLLAMAFQHLRNEGVLNEFLADRMSAIERAAYAYDASGSCDADEWVARLETITQREYSTSGAIQVMTLHKAKGLEFDMVVLPQLKGNAFDDASKAAMLEFKNANGQVQSMILPPKKDLMLADPQLRTHFENWAADQCYERFCNLYVALTRAKHATYVLLPKAGKDDATNLPRRHDAWLRAVVGDEASKVSWAGTDWHALRERGNAQWFRPRLPQAVSETEAATPITLGAAVPRRQRATPSSIKKQSGKAIAHSASGMAFGDAVHAAFERIGWIDEETPEFADDDAQQLVKRSLAAPAIRPCFERNGQAIELFREQPIEFIHDGKWLSGKIDRLHVHRTDGKVTAVHIYDFKTDAVEAAELKARYTSQMQAYRAVMEKAYPGTIVNCTLISTHLQACVEV